MSADNIIETTEQNKKQIAKHESETQWVIETATQTLHLTVVEEWGRREGSYY